MERQTRAHAHTHRGRKTDGWTDRQTNRQTDRHTHNTQNRFPLGDPTASDKDCVGITILKYVMRSSSEEKIH